MQEHLNKRNCFISGILLNGRSERQIRNDICIFEQIEIARIDHQLPVGAEGFALFGKLLSSRLPACKLFVKVGIQKLPGIADAIARQGNFPGVYHKFPRRSLQRLQASQPTLEGLRAYIGGKRILPGSRNRIALNPISGVTRRKGIAHIGGKQVSRQKQL